MRAAAYALYAARYCLRRFISLSEGSGIGQKELSRHKNFFHSATVLCQGERVRQRSTRAPPTGHTLGLPFVLLDVGL